MGFFRAVHKTTGEVVSFGLEDIYSDGWVSYYPSGFLYIVQKADIPSELDEDAFREFERVEGKLNKRTNEWHLKDWLKDYQLQYQHAGDWHDYKQGGEDEIRR